MPRPEKTKSRIASRAASPPKDTPMAAKSEGLGRPPVARTRRVETDERSSLAIACREGRRTPGGFGGAERALPARPPVRRFRPGCALRRESTRARNPAARAFQAIEGREGQVEAALAIRETRARAEVRGTPTPPPRLATDDDRNIRLEDARLFMRDFLKRVAKVVQVVE